MMDEKETAVPLEALVPQERRALLVRRGRPVRLESLEIQAPLAIWDTPGELGKRDHLALMVQLVQLVRRDQPDRLARLVIEAAVE